MKRNPRKVKWTKAYRKLAGKELAEVRAGGRGGLELLQQLLLLLLLLLLSVLLLLLLSVLLLLLLLLSSWVFGATSCGDGDGLLQRFPVMWAWALPATLQT